MADVPPDPSHDPDRSRWNWLLIIPVAVPLLPMLFNATEPAILGFPRFYWLQLAFIVLGVSTTTLVYQVTRRRRPAGVRYLADSGRAAETGDTTGQGGE